MKSSVLFYTLLFVVICHTMKAQVRSIVVTAKPFTTDAQNTLYQGMGVKLPQLISTGILYNSLLSFDPIGLTNPNFRSISSQTHETDSVFSLISSELRERDVQFFIEGDFHVMNDKFSLNLYATDFKTPLASYHSKIEPLAQLQQELDKACENLNYQIMFRIRGGSTLKVKIHSFKFNIDKNAPKSAKEIYASDFPAQYIAYNLRNSGNFAMLPYERVASRGKGVAINPDATISGIVTVNSKGKCAVQSVLKWNLGRDSLYFAQISGSLGARDKLLTNIVVDIQGVLNAIAEKGGLNEFFNTLEGYSALDYQKAFEEALRQNETSFAIFYAGRYAAKSSNKNVDAYLLKTRAYYQAGEFDAALDYANQYLAKDSLNEMANYYAGLCKIKLSKYEAAFRNFKRVKSDTEFRDIYFQRGLCFYGQNAHDTALREFETQRVKDAKANQDLYPFMGFSYQSLGDWISAENCFLTFYTSDSLNPGVRNYLVNFYQNYGDEKVLKEEFEKASKYYLKAYSISKNYGSLSSAIMAFLKQKKSFDYVNPYVIMGIKDSVLERESIYLDLADMCRTMEDPEGNFISYYLQQAIIYLNALLQNQAADKKASPLAKSTTCSLLGSTYFRMNKLDSAELWYRATLKWSNGDPIDYFNLVEVQIMLSRTREALMTLDETYKKFISSSKESASYYRALYYFYMMECKVMENQDYGAEKKALQEITKLYTYEGSLFEGWSFKTFYNWAKKGKGIDPELQNKILKNLCLVTQYSRDSSLPCIH